MTRHSNEPMLPHQEVIKGFTWYVNVPETMEKTQRIVTATYVRFKVTTCLYLSPSNKARSLSMLIAVVVNKDTEHRIWPVTYVKPLAYRQISDRSIASDVQYKTRTGSTMIPTQRSVIARLRYRSLDGAEVKIPCAEHLESKGFLGMR